MDNFYSLGYLVGSIYFLGLLYKHKGKKFIEFDFSGIESYKKTNAKLWNAQEKVEVRFKDVAGIK